MSIKHTDVSDTSMRTSGTHPGTFLRKAHGIGLYRENAIAIESEARDPFGGNVYGERGTSKSTSWSERMEIS